MAYSVITATYHDKIDEKSVWCAGESDIHVGAGPEVTHYKFGDVDVAVAIHHENDEALPTITLRQIPKGEEWKPQVGDGCSYGYNGDSYPYTVRRVSPSGKTVWVSRDRYEVKPGKGDPYGEGAKDCFFFPQDVADTEWSCYKLKKDGRYRPAGKVHRGCPSLRPGRCYSQNPHV